MSFEVTCTACGTRFALSDDLYTRKVKGRVVTVRCKRCSTDISVDATDLKSGPVQPSGMPSADDWDDVAAVHAPMAAPVPLDMTPTVPLQKVKDVAPAMQPVKDPAPAAPVAPGNAAAAAERAPKPRPAPATSAASSSVTKLWLVSFADEDDRELSGVQIQSALARGDITTSTIVWREGFSDWLPIHKVPELAALAPKRPTPPKPAGKTLLGIGAKPATAAGMKPTSPKPPAVAPKPAAAASKEESEESPPSSQAPLSIEPEPMSEPPAAPPIPGRGPVALSPGLLYVGDKAGPAAARGEPPPRPKLESKPDLPARPKLESKPDFGARERPKPPTPTRPVGFTGAPTDTPSPSAAAPADIESSPDSGTPDLRSLAKTEPKKGAAQNDFVLGLAASDAVDPLLGPPTIDLASIGAESPGLDSTTTAPAPATAIETDELAEERPRRRKPAADVDEPAAPAGEPKKRGGVGIWIALAAAVFLGVAWFKFRPAPKPAEPPATEALPPAPAPQETVTAPAPVEPAVTAETPPAPTSEPPSTAAAVAGPRTTERGPAASKPPVTGEPTTKPPAPAASTPPAKAGEPPAKPAGETEVAMAAPFDKAAAQSALTAAAGQASSCRKEGDPSGTAVVVVTFAPSGRATSANVGGPPFAGTATGGCIASTMRRAKVPAFSGGHMTVSKTVVIR
jgi:hypothetical protein